MLLKVIGTILSKVFTTGIGFLIVIITSKELGSSARGEIALMLLNISIIGLIQGIFNGSSLTFLTPRYSFLKLTLVSNLFSILLSFLLTTFFLGIQLIEENQFNFLLILSLFQGGLTSSQSLLLGKEKIASFNYLEIIKSITLISTLLMYFYVYGSISIELTFYAYLASYSLPFFISFIWLIPLFSKINAEAKSTSTLIYDFFKFGFQIQLNNISQMINYRFCFYLIEKLKGKSELGIFSVAISISEAIWIVCKSIATFQYSRLVNTEDVHEKKRITLVSLHLSFLATFPLIIILLLLPTNFFTFLFGMDFINLRPILLSLSIAVLELSYFTIINHYFTGIGQNKLNIFGSIIGNVTTVLSGVLLVPYLGSIGAGIATSISYCIMLIYLVYQFKKQSKSKFIELVPSIGSLKIFFTEQTT